MTDFAPDLAPLFEAAQGRAVGVAVSGGSDSLALLVAVAEYGAARNLPVVAATVDHGLRPEAPAEAQAVARICQSLSVPHTTLKWDFSGLQGNLQAQARRARYGLLCDWARSGGVAHVALGHTADDQAETFLMRLARGSGLDGLSGMARQRQVDGISFWRPLLAARRADLRAFLTTRGMDWIDDPSNADDTYDRVKARKLLGVLSELGIDVPKLTEASTGLRRARGLITHTVAASVEADVSEDAAGLWVARARFRDWHPELRRRILSRAVQWIARAEHGPRAKSLAQFEAALMAGTTSVLAGCVGTVHRDKLWLGRELSALPKGGPTGVLWDGTWQSTATADTTIAALGEPGLSMIPNWRELGVPRQILIASPAIWRNQQLLAAPFAGFPPEIDETTVTRADSFRSFLLSH